MPRIERVELPPAAVDGSAQWFTVHRRPTHGQAKAISQAFYERLNGSDVLGIETVVVRTLCPTAVVKDEEGRELPYGDDGEGVDTFPEDIVSAMYAEASKAIEELFPEGNRAGRRQRR
jgi:hypothetical protein